MADTTLAAAPDVVLARTSHVLGDNGTADGKELVSDLLGLANSTDLNLTATSRLLGRATGGAGKAEELTLTQALDLIGSAAQGDVLFRGASAWSRLAAGTNGHYLQTQGAGANPQWAAVAASGDDYDAPAAVSNPASPYTLPNSTGHAVSKITALAGNLTVNKPALLTGTTGIRYFRIVEITAVSADRTITWGAGISLGLGVAPSQVIPAGTTGRFVLYTDDLGTSWLYDGNFASATESAAGLVELATLAEVNTGTDAARAVHPDGLAGSYAGTKAVSLQLTSAVADDIATGDGQAWFVVPASMNGMNLVSLLMVFTTAGTTGTTDVQLRRVRAGSGVDMLSTKLTIDSGELTSATAAAAAVINASNDDVATGDIIYLDVDAVSTTAPKGGAVVAEFRLP